MYHHDEKKINSFIDESQETRESEVKKILVKAELKKGLSPEDAAILLNASTPKQLKFIFASAGKIKNEIYGNRLVLFAPLYLSDYCVNDCSYCGFHCSNRNLKRKRLDTDEIREQTELLIRMGHKRLLLEAGEHPDNSIDYVCDAIRTIYKTKVGNGEIRRVNVNIAATTTENYRRLKDAGIGTYQLFQETYKIGRAHV